MPVDDDVIRLDTRLAGQVRRYHTWPVLRGQSVAEHCWQLTRIYLSVCDGAPDVNMLMHIQNHDIGEHFTGDVPYPVKSLNPELKRQMDFLELKSQAVQIEYWDAFHPIFLTDVDKTLFKQMELMEMAEFGMGEVLLGNNHGYIVADRCLRALYEKKPCSRLVSYVIKRLRLFWKQSQVSASSTDAIWWTPRDWEFLHERQ